MARSAIGNYVHYHAGRYMQYGTSKNIEQEVSTKTWIDIKNNIQQKVIKQKYSNNKIKKIEYEYNKWRKIVTAGSNYKEARDEIVQMMFEKFPNQLNQNKTIFNFEQGDVYNLDTSTINKNIQNLQNINIKKSTQVSGKYITYVETVVKRFITAYNNLKKINSTAKQNEVEQLLNDVFICFGDVIRAEDMAMKELKLPGVKKDKKLVSADSAKDVIHLIDLVMGTVSNQNLGKALGEFEEYIGHAINLAIKAEATGTLVNWEQDLKKTISQGGSHHTIGKTASADFASINQEIMKELSKNSTFITQDKNGKYIFQTKYGSEQKMDVSFTYDPKNNKTAALSIKNYNLYSSHPIHIVTSSPLSTFLFNIGKVDVTNHFLNIFASHKNPTSDFKACRKIADDAFALQLLWAGLSGQGVGKTEGFADIFVVNNNKDPNNGVKMWDIGSLIDSIVKKGNLQTDLIATPPISSIILDNIYSTTEKSREKNIQRRLAKLILSAHTQKIEASINKRVLQY